MISIRRVADGRRIIASKNFIGLDGSRVRCLGTGIKNAKGGVLPGSRTAISDRSRNYYLHGLSRAGKITEQVLRKERSLNWISPLEIGHGHCQYRSRSYSNAEEKNLLVNDKGTGENGWGGPEAERLIKKLGDNIDESIKSYESLLVYFYTLWCKHCKKLKPVYGAAAVKMKEENVPGHLAAIDLTDRMDIADKFNIVSVPIMCYFKNGKLMKVYDGKRTAEDIVNFMKTPPEKASVVSKIDI